MLRFLCILSLSLLVHAKYETLSDLQTLFDDPELFRELEKRLGISPDEDLQDGEDSQAETGEESVLPVACFALSGTLQADCDFRASNKSIIKSKQSMGRGAEFLQDFSNLSCAKDCTAECCANPECDTTVYQDKEERNCYLFKCGGKCVFAQLDDYWMSTITKAAHNSHIPAIGEATNTHENELHGLQGSRDKELVDEPKVQSTTTVQTTTVPKPALGDRCGSYHTECEDPHAECMFHKCQCRVAMDYHAKHGVCRKRCRKTEFECDNEGYGPGVTQCVPSSYVCDGNQDCPDNSDEDFCPDKNPAYQDRGSMLDRNMYNNQPIYQSPYNQQDIRKYQYGYPLQGLSNQQVPLQQGANQIYPAQLPANQQLGGQYYIPGLSNGNQGGIPQTGSQMNSAVQLPYLDKGYGVGVHVPPYQNNIPYQNIQQQQYIPSQQSGFVPAVQNPVNTLVQPNQNQQVDTNLNSNVGPAQGNLANQVVPSAANQPVQIAQPVNPVPAASQSQPNQGSNPPQGSGVGQDRGHGQAPVNQATAGNYSPGSQDNADGNNNNQKVYPSGAADYNGVINQNIYDQSGMIDNANSGYHDGGYTTTTVVSNDRDWKPENREPYRQSSSSQNSGAELNQDIGPIENYHHHNSQEYDDQSQKVVKTDTQTDVTTGSAVTAQKGQGHINSEGFQDFSSWMHYDSDAHRVGGKKGVRLPPNHPKPSTKPPSHITTAKPEIKTETTSKPKEDSSQNKHPLTDKANSHDDRIDNYEDGYNTDQYNAPRFQDGNVPKSRFRDRQQRPNYGSKYPYYGGPAYRNKGGFRYPVYDPYREEYYYPDEIDNRRLGTSAETDYDDYRPDGNAGDARPNFVHSSDNKQTGKNSGNSQKHAGHSDMEDHPIQQTEPPTTETTTTSTAATSPPVVPNEDKSSTGSAESSASQTSDDNDQKESKDMEPDSKGSESHSKEEAPKDSNKTETGSEVKEDETEDNDNGSEKGNEFDLFASEQVEVVSYSDNTEGPIIALALGLAITMITLIFVGCRLRNVKRRLRKGRALHSNEADYLINGMYL